MKEENQLISFVVVSLFTSIPLELAIQVATVVHSTDGTLKDRRERILHIVLMPNIIPLKVIP